MTINDSFFPLIDKKVIFVVKKPEVIHAVHPDDMAIANLISLV